MQTKLLINGQLVAGEGAGQAVLNPSRGVALLHMNEASHAQVDAAVNAAAAAFDNWSQLPVKERAMLLLRLADKIEANAEELARLESDNCGKPFGLALNDEIPAIADVFRFFAGASRCLQGSAAGEYLHVYDPARPDWRGGLHRALELPVDDGRLEVGPGAGRGQHRGAQTVGANAADGIEARGVCR
jgi:acyl-CoA reductase-like NAD-dependent aldehyde dehydrogenase